MGFLEVVMIIVVLAAIALVAFVVNLITRKREELKVNKISFRETMDLISLPIVSFKQGNKKLNFLLYTGASYSIINESVVSTIDHIKTEEKGDMYGVEGNKVSCSYVNLFIEYNGKLFQDDFQVVDLSKAFEQIKEDFKVELHGILGNAFFRKYNYVLDYNELVAYSL